MPKQGVTLKDVAEILNLSIATVSLALRDDERIKPQTREKIKKTAVELGYRADLVGSMMSSKSAKVLGVIAMVNQELHVAYTQAITEAAEHRNYWVIVETANDAKGFERAYERLGQLRVNTVIAINPPKSLKEKCAVTIGQVEDETDSTVVTSANDQGINELIEHLFKLGHRHVAYLAGPDGISNRKRMEAIAKACRVHGMKMTKVAAGDNFDAGHQATTRLLAQAWTERHEQWGTAALDWEANQQAGTSERKTVETRLNQAHGYLGKISALVCYNDQCAQGSMIALWQSGLNVPEDISVTGFDNSTASKSQVFSLTTVDRNVDKVAELAVHWAIRHAKNEKETGQKEIVETKLVVRSSTGKSFFLKANRH